MRFSALTALFCRGHLYLLAPSNASPARRKGPAVGQRCAMLVQCLLHVACKVGCVLGQGRAEGRVEEQAQLQHLGSALSRNVTQQGQPKALPAGLLHATTHCKLQRQHANPELLQL